MAFNYIDINNFLKGKRQFGDISAKLFQEFGVPRNEWANWGFALLSTTILNAKTNNIHLVVVLKGTDNCIGPICNCDVDLGQYNNLTAGYNEVEIRDLISQIQSRNYNICPTCAARLFSASY